MATVSGVPGTCVDRAGTYTPNDLQHFYEPSQGQLTRLCKSHLESSVAGKLVLHSTAEDVGYIKSDLIRSWTTLI